MEDKCIVCGKPIPEHGEEHKSVFEGKEYSFCARGCKIVFDKSPQTYCSRGCKVENPAEKAKG